MRKNPMRRRRWLAPAALLLILALLLAACDDDPAIDLSDDDGDEESDGGDGGDDDGEGETVGADPDIEGPEGDPLKVGMATTLSGSIALFGVANQNGAQLAVDELNEAGGVLGRPVELIVRDDQARPEEGVAQARDLIIDEGIDVLLGPVSSGVALAINELSAEREMPFIVHTSNTDELMIEAFQPYMASVVPNTGMEARAQGVDLAEAEFTEWATIAPDYEFGQSQVGSFVDTITELNSDVEIIDQQWPELGESDYQPFISALLGSEPEAVYTPLFASDLVTFTRQADDLGFFDDDVYFTALYETDALQELGDEYDLEGVRAYSRCPFTIDTPQMQEFVEGYTERVGNSPSDWACMAYDAVKLWAEVVEDNGTADGPEFAETVGGFEFTSLRGDTYIREIDHQAAVGSYISELSFSDEHGHYVFPEAEPVPAEDIWLEADEIEERRGE